METTISAQDGAVLEAVAFVGETLAPLFLEDPLKGNADTALAALAALNVDEAAAAWPFTDEEEAKRDLSLIVCGLNNGASKEALADEYRRLFVGPGKKAAPPWGSVYTDRESVVFGLTTLELRDWLRTQGIASTGDAAIPEDHIGLMLALMAYVARSRPELLDDYLREHLLTWSSHFLDELTTVARHPFYEGLARLTKASLEGIGKARGITVACPRFYR